jgi:tRNA pseudouridine38-40 synthase
MTIQGKLEHVLGRLCGETVEVIGSGRTDAGVHAKAQVCNFKTDKVWDEETLMKELNAHLPEDISVSSAKNVDESFHSRFSAKEKTYVYTIWIAPYPPVFERKYVHVYGGDLNLDQMRKSAELFIGTHDFRPYSSDKTKKSTIRTIHTIEIVRTDRKIKIAITGDGFLYNMVRIIVGTLLDIGSGNRVEPVWIPGMTREDAGETAPACGLTLESVKY